MAAMPIPCNGILVFVGNSPRIFPVPSLLYASFLIPISIYNLLTAVTVHEMSFRQFFDFVSNVVL